MYPGIASRNEFTHKDTVPIHFRENEPGDPGKSEFIPCANISESASEYQIQMATPGLFREDFKIEVKDGVILIAANKTTTSNIYTNDRCEFDYHSWSRAFILPDDADVILIQATYINGELIIHIPKSPLADKMAMVTVYVY